MNHYRKLIEELDRAVRSYELDVVRKMYIYTVCRDIDLNCHGRQAIPPTPLNK